nr:hypothetical protein CFP56_63954 [Quercus suber]
MPYSPTTAKDRMIHGPQSPQDSQRAGGGKIVPLVQNDDEIHILLSMRGSWSGGGSRGRNTLRQCAPSPVLRRFKETRCKTAMDELVTESRLERPEFERDIELLGRVEASIRGTGVTCEETEARDIKLLL